MTGAEFDGFVKEMLTLIETESPTNAWINVELAFFKDGTTASCVIGEVLDDLALVARRVKIVVGTGAMELKKKDRKISGVTTPPHYRILNDFVQKPRSIAYVAVL